MKIYMIYAKLNPNDYKKLYDLLPLKNNIIYEQKGDKYVFLYAWTNKKSLLEKFKEERNMDRFKVVKTEIDDDDYNRFRVDMSDIMLDDREYIIPCLKSQDKIVHFITTKNEYVEATDNAEENFYYHKDKLKMKLEDYELFNDEIIKALDILNYTFIFDAYYLEDIPEIDISDRIEMVSFQAGYNLTPYGNRICEFYRNSASMLLFLFSPLFI